MRETRVGKSPGEVQNATGFSSTQRHCRRENEGPWRRPTGHETHFLSAVASIVLVLRQISGGNECGPYSPWPISHPHHPTQQDEADACRAFALKTGLGHLDHVVGQQVENQHLVFTHDKQQPESDRGKSMGETEGKKARVATSRKGGAQIR